MSFTVEIKGLRELQARFDRLPDEVQNKVRGQVQAGAMLFVRKAQRDAPRNKGKYGGTLAQGITSKPELNSKTQTSFEVTSNVEYSPFMEWGTITYAAAGVNWVTNLSGLADLPGYAITFKGRGIRKTGGIFPHPFFFKQTPIVKKEIEAGIKAELEGIKI